MAGKKKGSSDADDKKKAAQAAQDEGNNDVATPRNVDAIIPRNIRSEMEESYLTYAMSVIVMRALPDVRDGMKPVHRRVLYAMHATGLSSSAKFKKSATVVGEVIGKYHPHGDSAVYDTMVRMAQDFSLRYPLVNGQGNFGSIDGDSAAAMRYTEAKMTKLADVMMMDIEKNTVDFRDNYDGNHQEPVVLPARVPQLLLNGTVGIAVGMATNIPPHNLNEVIDGTAHLIDNPEATLDDLMKFVKGPDFPTGAIIYDKEAIKTMYATGRGGIVVRAKSAIEEMKGNRMRIVISEIPYQVNKANLIMKIANLVRDKKIQGISDLRDESDRKDKVRIVIELKKDAFPKKVLNQLFKHTNLQTSFNMNMIALVDGIQPQLLTLKACLQHFITHRQVVVRRRTQFELDKALARAHILEGLKKALDHIDEIIKVIKKSAHRDDARVNLMKKWDFSELQANAILDMRLQTLAGLESKKIEDELKEKQKLIKELEEILGSEKLILSIIKDELTEMREKFGDDRRTEVIPQGLGKLSSLDTVPNKPMIVALTKQNYIKRMEPSSFRSQRRGGKGIIGSKTKDEDEIIELVYARNHDSVLYFTNMGRVFKLPVFEIPKASKTARGSAIVNILNLKPDEKVSTMMISNDNPNEDAYLIMATSFGTVKKTALLDFQKVRKSGMIAIKLVEGDQLNWVHEVQFKDQVMMVTKNGAGIRFQQTEVRPMGRASRGVRGIRLKEKDVVVDMGIVAEEDKDQLLVIMENGLGKATNVKQYRLQSRGGSGVKTASLNAKTGKLVSGKVIQAQREADVIIISKNGQTIRLNVAEVPKQGRNTQGVYLMRMPKGDFVASVSMIPHLTKELEQGIEAIKAEVLEVIAEENGQMKMDMGKTKKKNVKKSAVTKK
ncbi:MAG: DNA gyrase subunit A [Candidatus Gracilibacteria bacterium]|nr:DNA gyrase subunit A [Candidatus Gracilibacteria bacterium]